MIERVVADVVQQGFAIGGADGGEVQLVEEPWQEVHPMFYETCRCGGLPELQAKVLYAVVYHFGPRWEIRTVEEVREVVEPDGHLRTETVASRVVERVRTTREPGAELREKLERFVEQRSPYLEQLREFDPAGL